MNLHAVCHTCKHQHLLEPGGVEYGWAAWMEKHIGHDVALIPSHENWQGYQHNADAYPSYLASSNLTVTNLHSIATSATWVAGWTGPIIDNTGAAPRAADFRLTAKITVAAAGLAAGEIRLYLIDMLDDTNWPDIYSAGTEGTEGTATFIDTEIRNAFQIADVVTTDTTASRVYPLRCPSVAAVFGGNIPHKFFPFICHSTGANLAASGNQVTVKGTYFTIA